MTPKLRFVKNILIPLILFAIFTLRVLSADPLFYDDDYEDEGRMDTEPPPGSSKKTTPAQVIATSHPNAQDSFPKQPPAGDSEGMPTFSWDISKACWDPKENKEHALEANWTSGVCESFHCKLITLNNIRSTPIAIAVEKSCIVPESSANYCAQLPKTTDAFPECCPLEVCILGNMINVTGTTPAGMPFNISQVVSNLDLNELTKLNRRELFKYALDVYGYNGNQNRKPNQMIHG